MSKQRQKRQLRRQIKRAAKKAVKREIRKHRGRAFKAGLILGAGWSASSYWTYRGFIMAAQETSTASFSGSVEALLAATVAAVVVGGCCGLLLGLSASESGDDDNE